MTSLDADTVFQEDDFATPVPHALEQSAADGRWDLPEPAFLRWWRALPEEDRGEFVGVYGGDEVCARFVCALDYLTVMQARPQSGTTITEAYAIAAGLPSNSEAARRGAVNVWKNDAVQALLDRLRYRSSRQAAARITNRTTAVIESMLADAAKSDVPLVEKAKVVSSALAFMRMVSDEDVQERVERTKRGFVNARKALEVSKDELEEITPEQAKLHVKILRDQLGEEAFKALVG